MTAGTADQQGSATNCNPKHLMGAGMVMLIIEDAVCPDACPTIGYEAIFEISWSTVAKKASINQHRKTRIVRNPVARLENYRLGVHVEYLRLPLIATERSAALAGFDAFSLNASVLPPQKAKPGCSPRVP